MCLLYVCEHGNMNSVQTSHDGQGSVCFAILNESLAGFVAFPVLNKSGSPSCFLQGICSCPDHPGALLDLLQFLVVFLVSLCGKVLVAWSHRVGFYEKLPEASMVSDRANTSWLQAGPALIKQQCLINYSIPIGHSNSALGML